MKSQNAAKRRLRIGCDGRGTANRVPSFRDFLASSGYPQKQIDLPRCCMAWLRRVWLLRRDIKQVHVGVNQLPAWMLYFHIQAHGLFGVAQRRTTGIRVSSWAFRWARQ